MDTKVNSYYTLVSYSVFIVYSLDIQMRSNKLVLNCDQYANDYEVLFHFSFIIMINPMTYDWTKSYALMDSSDTYVQMLSLRDTDTNIPESIFCLKNLSSLYIRNMPFTNGIIIL